MESKRPVLAALLHRLAECSPDFSEGGQDAMTLVAIVADHFRAYGDHDPIKPKDPFLSRLASSSPSVKEKRYRSLLAICVWLIHDDWFIDRPALATKLWDWLQSKPLRTLSELVSPSQFVHDPDRSEELVRLCLASIDVLPEGESQTHARDRLTTLDSVERQKVLQATAEAERRAREIREAMARQSAMESTSRYGE